MTNQISVQCLNLLNAMNIIIVYLVFNWFWFHVRDACEWGWLLLHIFMIFMFGSLLYVKLDGIVDCWMYPLLMHTLLFDKYVVGMLSFVFFALCHLQQADVFDVDWYYYGSWCVFLFDDVDRDSNLGMGKVHDLVVVRI